MGMRMTVEVIVKTAMMAPMTVEEAPKVTRYNGSRAANVMSDEKAETVDPGNEKIFEPFILLKLFLFCHRRRRKLYRRS